MHHSKALHVEMFWDPIFHIMKWAEAHSGLLNSVTICRCGRVNERWLVNLHAGVRFHVFHSHPRAILKQYELMRPHQFFEMWLGAASIRCLPWWYTAKLRHIRVLSFVRYCFGFSVVSSAALSDRCTSRSVHLMFLNAEIRITESSDVDGPH